MTSATFAATLNEAVARFQSGDVAGALRTIESLLTIAPDDPEALHLRALALSKLDRAAAAGAFERAASAHPRKDIILVNFGNFLKANGRLQEAREAYERATAFAPRSAGAWNALGLVCGLLGDVIGARKALLAAIDAEPQHASALNNFGNLEAAANRHESAVDYFTRALVKTPNLFSARINRGASLRVLGRLEEALADQTKAVALSPDLAEAHFQQAATLRTAGRFEEAVRAYRKAIDIDPARADIQREYANMAHETGENPFFLLDQAIEKIGSADLMVVRGETSLLIGDVSAAFHFAKRAILFGPEDARAHGLLARASRAQGDAKSAMLAARRAIDLSPDDFDLLHICCEMELACDELDRAEERLRRDAPPRSLQKHLALRAIALRATGDNAYRNLYDYDRLTAQIPIDPPPGYASVEAFNEALSMAISAIHKTKNRPADQTLYGGTQSAGRFWNEPDPVIQAYVKAMRRAATRFVESLPDDPVHPFLSRKSLDLHCVGAWSVMLESGGGHVDHIHPAGWVSACYYVKAPSEVLEGDRAGFLRLGASGVPGLNLPAERYVVPKPGSVVFFPSYMWHGVEPFSAGSKRITAPFDLAPLSS